jgi:hypothetical protein
MSSQRSNNEMTLHVTDSRVLLRLPSFNVAIVYVWFDGEDVVLP